MYQVTSHLSLSEAFRDPPRSAALWGIGGSGKSQLALRFIEKHRDNYTTIIWIDAQSPDAAIRSYSEAFRQLKLDYPQHIVDESRNDGDSYDQQGISTANNWIIHTVKEWLENTSCNWLVVIDNADSLTWIGDIMPKGRTGSLILTSRDRTVNRVVGHTIHVDKMDTEEALELLLRSANISSICGQQHIADAVQQKNQQDPAFLIVDRLGYMALAIDHAGAYISQHDLVQENLSLYLEFLKQNSAALLGNEALQDAGNYHHTVATVWEASFAAINKTSPASVHLLAFLAYLSPTRIDDRLFDEASMFMYQSKAHPELRFLYELLLYALSFYLPGIFVHLIFEKIIPPWKPHLKPHRQVRSPIEIRVLSIFTPSALVLIMIVPRFVEVSQELLENSVMNDHTVWRSETIKSWLSMGFMISVFSNLTVVLSEKGYLSGTIVLPLTSIIFVPLAVLEFYKINIDEKVVSRSRRLLDQLEFSHSNKAQFLTVARNIQTTSESAKGALYVLPVIAISLVVYTIFLRTRILRGALILNTIAACCSLALVFWPLGALLMSKKPSMLQTTTLVNNLLTTTSDGQWNQQAYSEVMAPLTRFSLIQREADAAYSMHVLVRWWARNRLSPEIQHLWTRDLDQFISMAYRSPTCSTDPLCQQILVPQLLEIANSGIASLGFTPRIGRNNLREILSKIDRSLMVVGKSPGILPDD